MFRQEDAGSVPRDDRKPGPVALANRAVALSNAQREVWVELQLNPRCEIYVLAGALRVDGPVVASRLERAIAWVIEECDALRLSFHDRDGVPYQSVRTDVEWSLPVLDFEDGERSDERCRAWMEADASLGFQRVGELLFSFALLRAGPARSYWYMKYSHLVFDGWSSGAFIGRVTEVYDAFSANEAVTAQRHSYLDFVEHEQRYMESPRYRADGAYWTALYETRPAPLFDRSRTDARGSHNNERLSIPLPRAVIDDATRLATSLKASLQDLALAALSVHLCLRFGRREVVVGIPTHNRVQGRFKKTPGMFTSVLPARVSVDHGETLQTLVNGVSQSLRRHYRHQQYPLSDLARSLHLTPTEARQLCDVTLSVEAFTVPARLDGHPATLRVLTRGFNRGSLHVVVQLHQGREGGFLHFDYDPGVLEKAEAEDMASSFLRLLGRLEAWQHRPLWQIEPSSTLATEGQRRWSFGAQNVRSAAESFLDVYARRVAATPEAVAVSAGEERLSFGALDARANRLARCLLVRGARPGDIVALRLDRSVDLVASFLAVLKAGCAYLPLDPSTPLDRVAYMCGEARPRALVTADGAEPALAGEAVRLDWVRDAETIASQPPLDPEIPIHGSALAYVTYTSGSTGRPVGVLVSHRGLGNLARAQADAFGVTEKSRVYAFASMNFDASVSEFVMALAAGATLDFGPTKARLLGPALCAYLRAASITHVTLPPSLLRALSKDDIPPHTSLIAAGEECPRAVIDEQPWARVFNAYGPTEATVCATIHEHQPAVEGFPIGRPITNTSVYILDEFLRDVAVGVVGTLYIGGVGVAWGYLGRPGLSADRFLPDPFGAGPGARMYCTGDLAKWRPDGNVEFCGRVDRQFKVRGHRVEPAEIEAALVRHPRVQGAVVRPQVRQDGTVVLAAYLAIKESRMDVGDRHVAEWRDVYDELFRASPDGGEHDFTGWVSSYTGLPIPKGEMQEWLEETVRDLTARRPRHVLEIGCGSGLVLSRLAPRCAAYAGVDLSKKVLEKAAALILGRPELGHVQLSNVPAHDLSGFGDEQFDTVILNSVVQYFPSLRYLENVLSEALRVTRPGGFIYLGDVRCLHLAQAFFASVEAHRSPGGITAEDLRRRVEEREHGEHELLIAPEWFRRWTERPEVTRVRVRLKHGAAHNELTRFRYQVILEVGDTRRSGAPPVSAHAPGVTFQELRWPAGETTLETVCRTLGAGVDVPLVLRSVPNARLVRERALLRWLASESSAALESFRCDLPATERGVDPVELRDLAARHGRELALSYAEDGDPFAVDAVFYRGSEPDFERSAPPPSCPGPTYSNDPTSKRLFQSIVPEIHARLSETLPAYMVPSAYAIVDDFPLTLHGKLDYDALPAPRPLTSAKREPSSEPQGDVERTLARIWSRVLGVNVGAEDCFVELGGDSIQCLQIVSKAREAGIPVSAKQIFEEQTIARIARLVERVDGAATSRDEEPSDPVSLTPIQRWFFEQPLSERAHFNQYVLVPLPEPIDPAVLGRALVSIEQEHDSLRLRFQRGPAGWQQRVASRTGAVPFEVVDLRHLPPTAQEEAIALDVRRRHGALHLETGPLWSATYYRASSGAPDRFLWVIHHLAVDGFSWRILMDELEEYYRQVSETGSVRVSRRTTAFVGWARRLQEYACSNAARESWSHWSRLRGEAIRASAVARRGRARVVRTVLDGSDGWRLTHEAPAFYRCETQDLLLAALMQALYRWTGESRSSLLMERHGREDPFGDVDLSRTTGWFTTLCPVFLRIDGTKSAAENIESVRAQIAGLARAALDYGVLRYLCDDPTVREVPWPAVSFNYLGKLEPGAGRIFGAFDAGAFGLSLADEQHRLCDLELQAVSVGHEFSASFSYDDAVHDEENVQRVARLFLEALRELLVPVRAPRTDRGAARPELTSSHPKEDSRGDIEEAYPLSPTQEGILFHSVADAERHTYFEQLLFTVHGELEAERFWRSWEVLVERHAVLRTRFVGLESAAAMQEVQRTADLPRLTLDWRHETEAAQRLRLTELLEQDRLQKFVLTRAPLFRLTLVRAGATRAYFLWSHHHAVLDGWSVPILLEELFEVYRALGNSEPLYGRPAARYRDYIQWLSAQRGRGDSQAYWRDALSGFAVPTPLEFATTGKSEGERGFAEVTTTLNEGLTSRLQALSKSRRVTLGVIVQGAWALLLSRCSGHCDVVFGTTSSGRSAPVAGIESIPGLFIHTVPVRVKLQEDRSVEQYLRDLQRAQSEREALPPSGLREIHECSDVPLAQPLFESLVVFENYPRDVSLVADLGLELSVEHLGVRTNYAVTLLASPNDRLELRLGYDTSRVSERSIMLVLGWVEHLLEQLTNDPDQPLYRIGLLSSSRHVDLMRQHDRSTSRELPRRTLVEMFAEQASRTPSELALIHGRSSMTYAELDRDATRLGAFLRRRGVGPESLVGVCLDRSMRLIVAILAIMKAGGAYVPLDPKHPSKRLQLIAERARLAWIIKSRATENKLSARGAELIDVDRALIEGSEYDIDAASSLPLRHEHNLAYVLHTSGSTGVPKGVAISSSSPVALIDWARRVYSPDELARTLFSTSINFDLSVFEIFAPLCLGGTVVVAENVLELRDLTDVTLVNTVPSAMTELLRVGGLPASVVTVNLAGEPVPQALVRELRARPTIRNVYNLYGPSETTTYSTCAHLDEPNLALPPIGFPLDHEAAYVLDHNLNLQAPGIPGDLYIGGRGLARGYLGEPGKTAVAFLPNPHSNTPGARLYRTGDLARYRDDGQIEFLGRRDHQVKIRGHRIELEEIESALRRCPNVADAVVCKYHDDRSGDFLGAHVTPKDRAEPPRIQDWKAALRRVLPEYAVPQRFAVLSRLPRSPNGKVDRLALGRTMPPPTDSDGALEDQAAPPTDHIERRIGEIFERLLHVSAVERDSRFFDLGGNSLLLLTLAEAMREELGVRVPLRDLHSGMTVAELAALVASAPASCRRATAGSADCAVVLQPGGEGPPLYLVAPASGSPMGYLEFSAAFAGKHPVIGLQYPGLRDGEKPLRSVVELAQFLLRVVTERHTHGPFLVGGWSIGGLVAFELTRQLRALGKEAAVFLLDTELMNGDDRQRGDGHSARAWEKVFKELAGLDIGKDGLSYPALQRLAAWLGVALPRSLQSFGQRGIRDKARFVLDAMRTLGRSTRVFWCSYQAAHDYRLQYLHADVYLFRTKVSDARLREDSLYAALASKVSGRLEAVPLPGTHMTLFDPPYRALLAEELQARLEPYDRCRSSAPRPRRARLLDDSTDLGRAVPTVQTG